MHYLMFLDTTKGHFDTSHISKSLIKEFSANIAVKDKIKKNHTVQQAYIDSRDSM